MEDPTVFLADLGACQHLAEALLSAARKEEAQHQADRAESLTVWASVACKPVANNGYKWVKGPTGWMQDPQERGRPLGLQERAAWALPTMGHKPVALL